MKIVANNNTIMAGISSLFLVELCKTVGVANWFIIFLSTAFWILYFLSATLGEETKREEIKTTSDVREEIKIIKKDIKGLNKWTGFK